MVTPPYYALQQTGSWTTCTCLNVEPPVGQLSLWKLSCNLLPVRAVWSGSISAECSCSNSQGWNGPKFQVSLSYRTAGWMILEWVSLYNYGLADCYCNLLLAGGSSPPVSTSSLRLISQSSDHASQWSAGALISRASDDHLHCPLISDQWSPPVLLISTRNANQRTEIARQETDSIKSFQ